MSRRPTPLRAEGEAQASAILAAGQAEAEAMDKKAAAFAGYNEAAVLQMLIEVMPKVAAELARPMAGIDKLTVISADGAGELPAPGGQQLRADHGAAQDHDRPRRRVADPEVRAHADGRTPRSSTRRRPRGRAAAS